MGIEDGVAAWMFDTAVTWFGITIENALKERVKVVMGKETEYRPRYSLALLLDPNFRLPKPPPEPTADANPWSVILNWAGKKNSGVKRYQYKSH